MIMPPSGIDGLMDEEAVIEAEIYQELENINLDDEVPPEIDNYDDIDEEPEQEDDNFQIDNELDSYIKRLQDQSNRFEEELLECDELLTHTSDKKDLSVSNALIPYEDHDLLAQLAREHGCDVEEYRRRILEDIENDEVVIEDELQDLIDDSDIPGNVGDNGDVTSVVGDARLPVKIGRAVEEGIDSEEIPVSQELVAVNGIGTTHQKQLEMQKMLKDELVRLESRYEDRMERMKKDDDFRKDEENLRDRRVMEERQWKQEEIQRQEKQIMFDREIVERESLKEQERVEKEMAEKMKQFEIRMATLQAENEKLRKEHELTLEMERQKFAEKQDISVRKIQRVFRGYRVRKEVGPQLSKHRDERRKQKEEERIKEIEVEIENRKEGQRQKEEEERLKREEEKRQKEELKRQKEEEKKRLEEEKKQKKLEEERIKQEEKRRKEEEKQKRKEEERKKKEEEKRRKEEEKRAKEEEELRKKEEKKMKEVEEKKRKEEEKRKREEEQQKKEEEKIKLEAEKKLKEEELKKEQEQLQEEEKNRTEVEAKQKEAEIRDTDVNTDSHTEHEEMNHTDKDIPNGTKIETNHSEVTDSKINDTNSNNTTEKSVKHYQENVDERIIVKTDEASNERASPKPDNKIVKHEDIQRSETPRSARRPKSARSKPSTPRKGTKEAKTDDSSVDLKKVDVNTDCLPQNLETLRLKFIEECVPWSKVSNEPWKLKAGLSRKPLRRPSSAKKLPPLPEELIIQSAKVASLKMVTTVELKDLPGNNISTLGQCGGLKYLTLHCCNLVALDGLSLCRQLQYIDVQGNKIEYVDLKDLGQLQYLNLSQNKLSSIHGLDSCTNLRWLDLSHNNITRLGGMDTLRRLFCLKISHCQLISTQGLGATPTLQMLDVSHNHLQAVEDLDKLCLLLSLNASANNILQVPNLKNQVLLTELNLSNNSLSSLSGIGSVWLPILCSLNLEQNSLTELSSLQNCLLLKVLNLNENQIIDIDALFNCVEKCFYLEELSILDNPVVTDLNDSFYSKIKVTCPRLSMGQDSTAAKHGNPLKPRTSIEAMCRTQMSALNDAFSQFQQNLGVNGDVLNQSNMCDVYYRFCDRVFNMAVEYRYSHEYGEVSFIPSAPTAPKSGRPVSARQREKFMNPKDMFENALKSSDSHTGTGLNDMNESKMMQDNPKDLFEKALNAGNSKSQVNEANEKHVNNGRLPELQKKVTTAQTSYSNPRDLFEQALKSADSTSSHNQIANGLNRGTVRQTTRGDKYTCAAVCIQAAWRGYLCRKTLQLHKYGNQIDIDPALVERVYNSAVKIQAMWKGYILRKKLLAALEYAQCDFGDDVDDDDMDFGDEFDFEKFVDVNQDLLDTDWRPPSTPDIPNNYPILRKPPSGKHKVPPINASDLHPPSNPRRAWRNLESPLSDLGGKIPRPPSSVASTELTMRSAVSRKEERMAEEWGFKDNTTAHLMMQRAKKMKLNSDRRKKISKLDPKQRLALFRKLEEVTHPAQYIVKQSRKTLPRKEYFQARQEEIIRQDREKHQEYQVKASRTFEWLHSQVGDHVVSDSVINQGFTEGPKYIPADNNLPELIGGGKRIHLVSSPMSVELQSVDSVSTAGHKPRRFSAGSGSSTSKLPPIQPTSAPAPHLKERMSFRNPPVNQSVGWGGGKKRGQFQ